MITTRYRSIVLMSSSISCSLFALVYIELVVDHADGREGKFKDILIATGYAMLPLILVNIPNILLSNAISAARIFLLLFAGFVRCDLVCVAAFHWYQDGTSVFGHENDDDHAAYARSNGCCNLSGFAFL